MLGWRVLVALAVHTMINGCVWTAGPIGVGIPGIEYRREAPLALPKSSIHGRVQSDCPESRLEGLSVALYKNNARVAKTKTDDDGEFEFSPIGSGSYVIVVGSNQSSQPAVVRSGEDVDVEIVANTCAG
jgi:hypothetical protein